MSLHTYFLSNAGKKHYVKVYSSIFLDRDDEEIIRLWQKGYPGEREKYWSLDNPDLSFHPVRNDVTGYDFFYRRRANAQIL